MRSQSLFYITVALIVAIAAANTFALVYGLYWRWPWLDIPMHFFGGLWIALFMGWFAHFSGMSGRVQAWPIWIPTVGGALTIGLLWEGFEIAIGATYAFGPYLSDMLFDLVMDVSGGLLAWGITRCVHDDVQQGASADTPSEAVGAHP